ncbi:hypothetical protein C7974DRAFT_301946, partial [Boeremia exigua]|uniref:uncharacterized protein n=1 Tax=Boeremia exigua TaxID=749465 RepID=UPI001E8DD011
VTNRNRNTKQRRIKDYKAMLIKRRLNLGLVAPNVKATNKELSAYIAILVKD